MIPSSLLLWLTLAIKSPFVNASSLQISSDQTDESKEQIGSISVSDYEILKTTQTALFPEILISQTLEGSIDKNIPHLTESEDGHEIETRSDANNRVSQIKGESFEDIISSSFYIEQELTSSALLETSSVPSIDINIEQEQQVEEYQRMPNAENASDRTSPVALVTATVGSVESKESQTKDDSSVPRVELSGTTSTAAATETPNSDHTFKEIIDQRTNTEAKLSLVLPENLTIPMKESETFPDYANISEALLDLDHNSSSESPPAQFLSFEDWKKIKGVESEKSINSLPQSRLQTKSNTNNAGGALGEEMEIDLSNFFDASEQEPEGKLYKDKFNFASFDCAATIVKTNSEAKGATSILFENKESYLLNPCSATNKFVTIELCQDILVDSVVIGNFEFFSSTFKRISISVSETFPVPKNGWKNLGIFEARDVRDYQTFKIENPMIWAKYFRIEILEHYGNEYYCPLSIVRVHGRTMMQEYKQEESKQQENEVDDQIEMFSDLQEKGKLEPNSFLSNSSSLSSSSLSSSPALSSSLVSPSASVSASSYTSDTPSNTTCEPDNVCIADKSKLQNNSNSNHDLTNGNLTNLNLTNFNECSVTTLPMLKFEEFFRQFNDKLKCEEPKISTVSTPKPISSVGTQESIYKNIMKRLSLLESNATLSVLYIEEQSKLLSRAFTSLEKKQSQTLSQLTTNFNKNIMEQIKSLQALYDTFQLQTEKYLQSERSNQETVLKLAYERIDALQIELKFQKILTLINLLVIFGVLIYVIITRDTYIDTEYIENDKVWIDQQRQRITSTSSRLKTNIANFTKYYYNSDTGSAKSDPNSDVEEIYDGAITPESSAGVSVELKEKKFDEESIKTGPITPDNSDNEDSKDDYE